MVFKICLRNGGGAKMESISLVFMPFFPLSSATLVSAVAYAQASPPSPLSTPSP